MRSIYFLVLLNLYACDAFFGPASTLRRNSLMTRTAGKASKASSEEDRLDFAVGSLCEFDDGKGHVFVGQVCS